MGEFAGVPEWVARVAELSAFVQAGLHAEPPQAGLADEVFRLDAQQFLADAARDLAADAGEAGVDAVGEVLAATAAASAQERHGRLSVDEEAGAEAVRRVQRHAAAAGLEALVRCFHAVTLFEDLQAVLFYQPMPERVFVAGRWHRPWAGYPLDGDLLREEADRLVRAVRLSGGGRGVAPTAHGRHVVAELRGRLQAAGMLAARRRELVTSHRNRLAHEAEIAWTPDHVAWAEMLACAGLGAGSRILVCGLAFGGDAFLRQTAAAAGAGGSVVVVDPAVAVLRRVAPWMRQAMPPHVRLQPGRFEALPLSDAAVDACLAPSFLHLAEHERAVAEVRRVLRPGGRVALAVPHAVSDAHALLREWLEPLLALAERLEVADTGRLHHPGQAGEVLARHGFVDVRARPLAVPMGGQPRGALLHFLHTAEVCRGVLERVPWRERHALLHDLLARGERLWAATGAGADALLAQGELIVATAP